MTTGMKAHRRTENPASNPTISTQKKGLRLQDPHRCWVQQGTRAGWSKAESPPGHEHSAHPHCPSPHSFSSATDPQQLEEKVQGHAGAASPLPSPPREQHVTYSTLSPCSGNHGIICTRSEQCYLPAFLLPCPWRLPETWVGGVTGTWARAMDSSPWQEQERRDQAGLGY